MFGLGKKREEVSALVLEREEEGEAVDFECAWCLDEQGIASVDGSHGICFFHSQKMVAQAGERRAWRRRQRL